MARQSNYKEQLFRKFKRSMSQLAPSFTLVDSRLSDNSPAATIKIGATAVAYAAIQPLALVGFNVVAELSTSAGEGFPEHSFLLYFDTDASGMDEAQAGLLAAIARDSGCSSLKIYSNTSAPAAAAVIDGNLKYELSASAEAGSVGA